MRFCQGKNIKMNIMSI